ncbi:MAG: (d)CMP kinase [Clostridia bacterium]|nr:(d)CMP kinase [Clostridia bacterium]
MEKLLRIAIDGPSGAGKSTMAKILAKDLNIDYIDTGAMYRAIALKIFRTGIDPNNAEDLAKLLKETDVDYSKGSVFLDGENVDGFIRTQEVSEMASVSSAIPAVREKLVALQKAMGERKSLVMDGRDIGTNVLTGAECKFFLTASAHVRALRRAKEYEEKGLPCNVEQVEADIQTRDYRDSHRATNPLKQADDAVLIDSSDMTIGEVVDEMKKYIQKV